MVPINDNRWWRFWDVGQWREWRHRRGPWTEYKSASRSLPRVERSALTAPPRPVSPGWVPFSAVFVLIALSATASPDSPGPEAAATTTTLVETTTTSSSPSTTSSIVATTTTTTANPLLAPPAAGLSGDPTAPPPADSTPATVDRIVDGDTIWVTLADGTPDELRLIGINTPEVGECLADEASQALAALIPVGRAIALTRDVSDRDQFDRALRYVWVGGFSVNEELVRRGAAIARRYPPDTAMANRLEQAQAEASGSGLGLWARDACGPAASAALRVLDVVYDAPGDDNVNLNEEWVSIRNDGPSVVDLTGWGIKDESASNRFQFPDSFTLAAGETVTIRSGCGDDFGTELFWCSVGAAVWNNDGDTVFLLDPSGNTHHSQRYTPPTTTTTQAPTTTTTEAEEEASGGNGCHPSYVGECVPVGVSDVDCAGGSGNGPYYVGRVTVVGPDEYGLDRDKDGVACES